MLCGCQMMAEELFSASDTAGAALAEGDPTTGGAQFASLTDASNDPKEMGSLASVIAKVGESETGEWKGIFFSVKKVFYAASNWTCREVELIYPDSVEPVDRLVCGFGKSAFVAPVIF